MQIEDATFVVTDTETTGTKAGRDRLIEIGAVKVRGGEVVGRFSQLIDPERSVPARITQITGVTSAMVFDQPAAREVLPRYLDFLGEGVLVAHNLPFDRRFLEAELKRAGHPELAGPSLCTLRLARRLLPGLTSKGLSSLIDFYGIRVNGRHRAAGDAEATAAVLRRLLSQLDFEHGIDTLKALLAFQRRSYRQIRRVPSHLQKLRREVLPEAPDRPGVYFMKDGSGATIYIGKAKSLRDRVKSYFRAVEAHPPHRRKLVRAVRDVSWTVTPSELDALLLESRLIKEEKPRFNRAARRYRSRPFIRLDMAEEAPRVSWTRQWADDGAAYFGPLGGWREAEFVLELLRRFFPLRRCDDEQLARGERCLYADMDRCTAPCEGDAAAYAEVVEQVRRLLSGEDDGLLDEIEARMRHAAERLAFERAAEYRDMHRRLKRLLARRRFVAGPVREHHAVLVEHALVEREAEAVRCYAVRFGRHVATLALAPPGEGEPPRLRAWLDEHFGPEAAPPAELSKRAVDEMRLLASWLYRRRDDLVQVRWSPERDAGDFAEAVRAAAA